MGEKPSAADETAVAGGDVNQDSGPETERRSHEGSQSSIGNIRAREAQTHEAAHTPQQRTAESDDPPDAQRSTTVKSSKSNTSD